jgi:DNA-directed RNA polymerase specialized sigma24 family protein
VIVYIDVLLHKWGRVVERGMVSGLSYPKAAAFTRLTPSATRPDATISDMWDVDKCVAHLDQAQHRLVHMHYVQGKPIARVARELDCHRDTCYARLHTIHVDIMNMLNDMSAGVPLQKKN